MGPSKLILGLAATLIAASTVPAGAVLFTGNGTVDSQSVAATANFTLSGGNLQIILTNTSVPNGSQETPTNTLSGLAFDINGQVLALTPMSAISPNSIFQANLCSAGCAGTNVNVGGEWGYQFGSGGVTQANLIGSAGYVTTGLPGNLGNFGGTNLDNPASLDGINFGVVQANLSDGINGGLAEPLIQNTLTLTLGGLPLDFALADVTNVLFLYGTAFGEGSTGGTCPTNDPNCSGGGGPPPGVPEPATLFLFGSALLGYGAVRRRRRQS